MTGPTLYERVVGVYAIAAVIDHFSDQLMQKHVIENNLVIKEWNEEKSAVRLPDLKFLRTLWLCAISGGPAGAVSMRT